MSAYNRGELSIEAYLVRVLAALCRQNGGEVRIKGELIDTIGEATTLTKYWDSTKQELVLQATLGMFGEVFRVVPEKQAARPMPTTAVDPLASVFRDAPPERATPAPEFLPKNNTLDDERVAEIERTRRVRQAAAVIRDELARNNRERQRQENERIPL